MNKVTQIGEKLENQSIKVKPEAVSNSELLKVVRSDNFELVRENFILNDVNIKLEKNNKGLAKLARSTITQRNLSMCFNVAFAIALILINN